MASRAALNLDPLISEFIFLNFVGNISLYVRPCCNHYRAKDCLAWVAASRLCLSPLADWAGCSGRQVICVFAGGLDFSAPVRKFFYDPLGSGRSFVDTVISLTGTGHPLPSLV